MDKVERTAMTRLIGYARVSTTDQEAGLSAQMRDLEAAGVGTMFTEKTSAVGGRVRLENALAFLQSGDTLVVTKLDRLARNVAHLCEIVERIKARGASLRILAMGLDTGTPTGTLMLNVLGAVAQFEREIMLERQREGIAKAKAAGKYKGRVGVDAAKVKAFCKTIVDNAPAQLGREADTPTVFRTAAGHFEISVRQVQRIVRGK